MYKEDLRKLIVKGILGMVIGMVLVWVGMDNANFFIALLMGFFFAGVPYGWQLSSRFLGGMVFGGGLVWMLFAFFIRFLIALVVGWVAYPIVLIYTIVKASQE